MAKGKKTGGRQKGTPNRDKPLKIALRAHSEAYFTPRLQTDPVTGGIKQIQRQRLTQDEEGNVYKVIDLVDLADANGNPVMMSDFEADLIALSPNERVNAELHLIEFHTPKLKAVDVDLEANISVKTIEDRLRALCGEDDDDEEE